MGTALQDLCTLKAIWSSRADVFRVPWHACSRVSGAAKSGHS